MLFNRSSASATGELRTRPWLRRVEPGLYVGSDSSVWMFRQLPLSPLAEEDGRRRLEVGDALLEALGEIGSMSKDWGGGLQMLSQNRTVHYFGVTWERPNTPPVGTPKGLAELQSEMLTRQRRDKAVLLGVKLRSSIARTVTKKDASWLEKVRAVVPSSRGDAAEMSLDPFADDARAIDKILKAAKGRVPDEHASARLESWWNLGRTADSTTLYFPTHFMVPGVGKYQISSARTLPRQMQAPNGQWLMAAMSGATPATVVSIRAELEPASVTRARLRRTRRKMIAQEQEEAATGDIGREENEDKNALAQAVESYVVSTKEPWLVNASVLMAHELRGEDDETYVDVLKDYGVEMDPLVDRQLEGLHEMQPTSWLRNAPTAQDVNLSMVADAGLQSFSHLGEDIGLYLGQVDPDGAPAYHEPYGASRRNKGPVWCLFGDPGSGKTFAAQMLAVQAAQAGISVMMVNPKGFDSLSSTVEYLQERGIPARTVSFSQFSEEGGAFDPFKFCADPLMAAQILSRHIETFLGPAALPDRQGFILQEGLANAARLGAKCAMDALEHVADKDLVALIKGAARSNPLIALGFANKPGVSATAGTGLTLIEFDRGLDLPKGNKVLLEQSERAALAALRLASRAALESLMTAGGGLYIIDEAHHYLASKEGADTLERLGREGRSMGLLPIFITQQPGDLLEMDMESYMSRVTALKLQDPEQARAALRLCGLEPTEARLAYLAKCGPRQGGDGVPGAPARGIMRDLSGGHAAISVGPVPEELRLAISTNRDDRALRAKSKSQNDPTKEAAA